MFFWILRQSSSNETKFLIDSLFIAILFTLNFMSIYFQYYKIVSKCLKENTFEILPEEFGGPAFAFLYSRTSYLISVSVSGGFVLSNCCKCKPEPHLCSLAIFTFVHLLFSPLYTCYSPADNICSVSYIEGHVFKF